MSWLPRGWTTVVGPESVLLRALAGLSDGTGRTVVVQGPPGSGKSAVLAQWSARLDEAGTRVVSVAGNLRERGLAYAAAGRMWEEYERVVAEGRERATPELLPADVPAWAMPPPLTGPPLMSTQRLQAVGRRSPELHPEEFWTELVEGFRRPDGPPVAFVIDDATLFDAESREFVLHLSGRTRLRPLLLVLALDTSLPSFGAWDSAWEGRIEVERVEHRFSEADLRDAHRVRALLKGLPPEGRRIVEFVALLGGSATPIELGRITRAGLGPTNEALRPALAAGLLKMRGDRVALVDEGWVPLLLDAIPTEDRSARHGQVATGLIALHPEPGLDAKLRIADHLYAHAKDAAALRALTAAAEGLERVLRFDEAEDALSRAVACAASLGTEDRLGVEAALRVERARLLVYAGRLPEVERELRESFGMAVLARLSRERLEELFLSVLPALRLAGPRPALLTDLGELADRFHEIDAFAAETLVISVLIEYDLQRGQVDRARSESARIGRLARYLPRGPIQAVALLSVAAPLLDGTEEERRVATRCLRTARSLLATHRNPGLHLYADEVQCRRLLARGERSAASTLHEQAVGTAQKGGLLPYELLHRVALAQILIEERADPRTGPLLARARELCDRMHLIAPSAPLLQLALLEGRMAAHGDRAERARDWWTSVAELRSPALPPAARAEAWLRLADLELTQHHAAEAERYLAYLERPEFLRGLRLDWAPWLADLRSRVDRGEGALEPGVGWPLQPSAGNKPGSSA
jgi:hypothetical protein